MNRVLSIRGALAPCPVVLPQWQPIGLVQLVIEAGYAWRHWKMVQDVMSLKTPGSRKTGIFPERDARVLAWLIDNDCEGGSASVDIREGVDMLDHEVHSTLVRLREAGKVHHFKAYKKWRVAHA